MPTTKKNINFNRARLEQGMGFYKTKGIAPQTAQLRVVVPFSGASGNYKFDFKKDPSLAHVIEQLLKRNDLFVARAIGLALMVELNTAKGTAPLYSYPVQAGAALPIGLKGFTDNNAYAVYNGILTMKTGQSVNYSRFPTAPFLNVPETQPQLLWNGTAGISAGIAPQFNAENVMFELPEVLVLSGTKDQPVTLEFPACTIAGEASTTAYAVLIVEGWLYEGATTEEMHSQANPYNDNF
jgi:hypothetical protein